MDTTAISSPQPLTTEAIILESQESFTSLGTITSSQEDHILDGEPRVKPKPKGQRKMKYSKSAVISGVKKVMQLQKHKSFAGKLGIMMGTIMTRFIPPEKHNEYQDFVTTQFAGIPIFSNYNGLIDSKFNALKQISHKRLELFKSKFKKRKDAKLNIPNDVEDMLIKSIVPNNFVHFGNPKVIIPERMNESQCISTIKDYQSKINQGHADSSYYNAQIGGCLKTLTRLYKDIGVNLTMVLETYDLKYKKTMVYFLISWYDLVSEYPLLMRCGLSVHYICKNFKYIKLIVAKNPIKWK